MTHKEEPLSSFLPFINPSVLTSEHQLCFPEAWQGKVIVLYVLQILTLLAHYNTCSLISKETAEDTTKTLLWAEFSDLLLLVCKIDMLITIYVFIKGYFCSWRCPSVQHKKQTHHGVQSVRDLVPTAPVSSWDLGSVWPSVMAEAVTILSNILTEPESIAEFPVSVFY